MDEITFNSIHITLPIRTKVLGIPVNIKPQINLADRDIKRILRDVGAEDLESLAAYVQQLVEARV